ncbi:MAG: hypothetical protein U0930_10685 [Pirellulales bacterium]
MRRGRPLALIRHIADFREESTVATWVLRIATNNALKILRKKRTVKMIQMSEMTYEDNYGEVPHPEFIAPWSQTAEVGSFHERRSSGIRVPSWNSTINGLVFVLRDVGALCA